MRNVCVFVEISDFRSRLLLLGKNHGWVVHSGRTLGTSGNAVVGVQVLTQTWSSRLTDVKQSENMFIIWFSVKECICICMLAEK